MDKTEYDDSILKRSNANLLLAEYISPECHELFLVETAILVLVEHLHQMSCSLLVEAHSLLDQVDDFFWA